MAKRELKKFIEQLDDTQLRNMILEAYSARKEIKEYFDFFINPDSDSLAQKFCKKIAAEFISRNGQIKRRPRRSACKRAIADMKKFSPDPSALIDVFIFYCTHADNWMRIMPNRMSYKMSQSVADTLCEAMEIILSNSLIPQYHAKINTLIENSQFWGINHQQYLTAKWEEIKSKSVASLLSRSIQPEQNEDEYSESP